jgi:phospholipase/carboxylesterase
MTDLLPCVEHGPADADASILWLHGLGADGHDFEPVVPALGLDDLAVRFVFPHAPSIPVTINAGMVMPAWYDIRALELERLPDEEGVHRSAEAVEALLARELERGVRAERVVLAGFSQGGAVAAHVALRHPARLAGLVLLSTYLVCTQDLAQERSEASRGLPVFQAHGLLDPMVVPDRGTAARDLLQTLGHPVDWSAYPMGHEVCLEEIRALGAWLRERWTA